MYYVNIGHLSPVLCEHRSFISCTMPLNDSNASKLLDSNDVTQSLRVTPIEPLAAIGVVINFAAFIYVAFSSKIRRPLKAALFNLVVSDCMFLTGVCARGIIHWNESTLQSVCPIFTILILIPSPISYSAVFCLSVYNFIAVYKPIKFGVLVTTLNAIYATVLTWALTLVIAIVSMAVWGKQDPNCSLLAQAPPFILVFFAVFCILCSIGMAALNISVALKLRSTRSVGSTYNKNKSLQKSSIKCSLYNRHPFQLQIPHLPSVKNSLLENSYNSTSEIGSTTHLPQHNPGELSKHYSREGMDEPLPQISNIPSTQYIQTIPATNVPNGNNSKEAQTILNTTDNSMPRNKSYKRDSFNTKLYSRQIQPESSEIPQTYYSMDDAEYCDSTRSNTHESTTSIVKDSKDFQYQSSVFTKETLALNVKCSQQSITSRNDTSKDELKSTDLKNLTDRSAPCMPKKMRSTVMTLIILAFWNALLTFPILGMWLWMATVVDVKHKPSYAWVSNVLSILAILNSMTNPILYAWRFVEWRKLYMKCLRRRGTVHVTTDNVDVM